MVGKTLEKLKLHFRLSYKWRNWKWKLEVRPEVSGLEVEDSIQQILGETENDYNCSYYYLSEDESGTFPKLQQTPHNH